MKRLSPIVAFLVSLPLAAAAQVDIGTTSPDASVALGVRSGNKGLLNIGDSLAAHHGYRRGKYAHHQLGQ